MRLPFDDPNLYNEENEVDVDDRRREQEMWIAGALAKAAEDAGLIRKTDEFSWEWHQLFDAEIEAAKAELAAPEMTAPNDIAPEPAPQTPSAAAPNLAEGSSCANSGAEFGSDFGGGFGGNFGGGFGGDIGGNF